MDLVWNFGHFTTHRSPLFGIQNLYSRRLEFSPEVQRLISYTRVRAVHVTIGPPPGTNFKAAQKYFLTTFHLLRSHKWNVLVEIRPKLLFISSLEVGNIVF